QDWEWTDDLMSPAADRLAAWSAAGSGSGALDEARAALDDDLDTPEAIRAVDAAVARGEGVSEAGALLGVLP
ncbi:MAG: cysteine--tRNA ligase, partial [Acidimicrobiales bacterium]